jgi:uncharacterized protein (DUF934 family)
MRLIDPAAPPDDGALMLDNTADVLAADIGTHDLIVLQFPKWTDGRAYSQARLLRGRRRYRGELRAVGEVIIDMLPLLERCGFDSARLRADQNPESARRALGFFSAWYQGDVAGARPWVAQGVA